MSDMNKIIADMTMAKNQYELAKNTGIGLAAAKEQMKNVAFNYFDELLAAVKEGATLTEQITALNVALEDSDKELAELKAAAARKPTQAKKAE